MTITPCLALVAIIGSLGYLALAIIAFGGIAAFFAHPARIALAAILFILTGVSLFSGGNLSSGEREDRGNRWVLIVFGIIGLLLAFVPAYMDRIDVWTIDGDTARWIGVALFAGSLVLMAAVVLAARPVILRPIAALTGKVGR